MSFGCLRHVDRDGERMICAERERRVILVFLGMVGELCPAFKSGAY